MLKFLSGAVVTSAESPLEEKGLANKGILDSDSVRRPTQRVMLCIRFA